MQIACKGMKYQNVHVFSGKIRKINFKMASAESFTQHARH